MSWPKKLLIFNALVSLSACGVKGDPLPPEKPAELGRGRPTYKGASEEIHVERHKRHDNAFGPNKRGDDTEGEDNE